MAAAGGGALEQQGAGTARALQLASLDVQNVGMRAGYGHSTQVASLPGGRCRAGRPAADDPGESAQRRGGGHIPGAGAHTAPPVAAAGLRSSDSAGP